MRSSQQMPGDKLPFLKPCLNHPRVCITIAFLLVFASSFYRVAPDYQAKDDLNAVQRMILFNGWDDGETFFLIMSKGYGALPVREYRELPLYPLVARIFSVVTGKIYSLLVVSFLSSLVCCHLVFSIFRKWGCQVGASLGGALFFLFLRTPESVISLFPTHLPSMESLVAIQGSEPLFLLFVLLSYMEMLRERHPGASLSLVLASLTRLSGCFVAFGAFLHLVIKRDKRALWYGFSPLAILVVFFYYYLLSGDFLAFFHGSRAFYPEAFLSWPFHDLIERIGGNLQNPALIAFYVIFHAWFIGGLFILWKRNRRLFWLTLPQYLVAICLKGWSHHVRYYIVLWGVNAAWCLFLVKIIGGGHRKKNTHVIKCGEASFNFRKGEIE